jgi:uncharacterized protein (TIGR02265 family)
MDNFQPIDLSSPLNTEELLAAVPEDLTVKGIFFRSALKQAAARTGATPLRKKYLAFSEYPVSELIEVLVACAKIVHPDQHPREALRRLGQQVFPVIKDSTPGRFLFSITGNSIRSAFRVVGRAYSLLSKSEANLSVIEDNLAIVEIRNAWTFPDCYHVGVFEGAVNSFGAECQITVQNLSLSDVDLMITW